MTMDESFSYNSMILSLSFIAHVCNSHRGLFIYSIQSSSDFLCRCILVDENDRVVGHDTKYNCK